MHPDLDELHRLRAARLITLVPDPHSDLVLANALAAREGV